MRCPWVVDKLGRRFVIDIGIVQFDNHALHRVSSDGIGIGKRTGSPVLEGVIRDNSVHRFEFDIAYALSVVIRLEGYGVVGISFITYIYTYRKIVHRSFYHLAYIVRDRLGVERVKVESESVRHLRKVVRKVAGVARAYHKAVGDNLCGVGKAAVAIVRSCRERGNIDIVGQGIERTSEEARL